MKDADNKATSKHQQDFQLQTVCVCVCTYRRPQLVDCLASIVDQPLPEGFCLSIVVVDNCPDQTAASIVNKVAHDNPTIPVRYLSCSVKNLSVVRNAAIAAAEGKYIALVDDDEVVSANWLINFIDCAITYNADIVIGPVHNIYSETCPPWLKQGDLMIRPAPTTGQIMRTGHAGNAFIRHAVLKKHAITFDEQLGKTGGEDTDFFYRLHKSGVRIIGCSEAIAHEKIDPARENMAFMLQENKRIGQVFCLVFWPNLTLPKRIGALFLVLVKTSYFGLGLIATWLFGKRYSGYWRLRLACNIEKIRYLLLRNQTIHRYCT